MSKLMQKAEMRQLYQRAIMDRPRHTGLGRFNRRFGAGHTITPAEVEFFAQHRVDVSFVQSSKHGDDLLLSIIQNPQVKAAFEDYARDCAAEGRKPFLTDKIAAHVGRMTSRRRNIEPEMICGIAMLRNRLRIQKELLDRDDFLLPSCRMYGEHVLQIEGEGMTMFYTFAPYLHEVLTQNHGLSQSDSIMLVASWPFRSIRSRVRNTNQFLGNLLLGIEYLYRPYYLGDNPAGPSHEFTRLMALEVAEVLLQEAA